MCLCGGLLTTFNLPAVITASAPHSVWARSIFTLPVAACWLSKDLTPAMQSAISALLRLYLRIGPSHMISSSRSDSTSLPGTKDRSSTERASPIDLLEDTETTP